MKSINIRGVVLGDGIPKIIVPIVGTTRSEILSKAAEIVNLPVQLIEWRADFYDRRMKVPCWRPRGVCAPRSAICRCCSPSA